MPYSLEELPASYTNKIHLKLCNWKTKFMHQGLRATQDDCDWFKDMQTSTCSVLGLNSILFYSGSGAVCFGLTELAAEQQAQALCV